MTQEASVEKRARAAEQYWRRVREEPHSKVSWNVPRAALAQAASPIPRSRWHKRWQPNGDKIMASFVFGSGGAFAFPGEQMAEVFVRLLGTAGGGRARPAGEAVLGRYAEGSDLPPLGG